MHYTDIENIETEDGTIVNWRMRRGKAQIKCPYCFKFFDMPQGFVFDANGYARDSVYHFCDDDQDQERGYMCTPHLVGYNV